MTGEDLRLLFTLLAPGFLLGTVSGGSRWRLARATYTMAMLGLLGLLVGWGEADLGYGLTRVKLWFVAMLTGGLALGLIARWRANDIGRGWGVALVGLLPLANLLLCLAPGRAAAASRRVA